MRKFYLRNSIGEEIALNGESGMYFTNPQGLGYTLSPEVADLRHGFYRQTESENEPQGEIVGDIAFVGTSPYELYNGLINWINKGYSLEMAYEPRTVKYYRSVEVKTISKGEFERAGYLLCPCKFACYTPWYLANPISVRVEPPGGSGNATRYSTRYPARYQQARLESSVEVQAHGHVPSAVKVNVTLTNEGSTITVEQDSTVIINAKRTDGSAEAFFGTVNENGTVTVPLTSWMLEFGDTVRCDISIIDAESRKLTSTSFSIEVEAASVTGDDISSDDNFDILVTLIEDCTEAKTGCEDATTAAETAAENANMAAARANSAASHTSYIGDNGNWFVWDSSSGQFVDTGVRAAGQDGSDANVTADNVNAAYADATDAQKETARTNIGAAKVEGDYDLIEEITLAEDTRMVERRIEPNGTAYNFVSVIVSVNNITTPVTGYGYLNGSYYGFYSGKYNRMIMEKANGCLFSVCYGSMGSAISSAANGVYQQFVYNFTDNITSIKITGNGNVPISAGTAIGIYGVRA